MPGVGPYGVAGHLGNIDGVLHIVGRGIGNSRDDVAVAAGRLFGYKTVFICKVGEHVAGGADLGNNLVKGIIAQLPVAFPCFKAVELGRLYLLQVGKNRIKVRIRTT